MPSVPLKNLIEYATLAADTAREIARSPQIPFLVSAAALSSSVLECIEALRSNKEECAEMVEQLHEIICTIIKFHAASEKDDVLATPVLYDIANFAETLQKIFTFLQGQQKMGKVKRLLKQADNASQLRIYNQELGHTLQKFKIRVSDSTIQQMTQFRKDAKQQHEELVALLAAHPDLTNSDQSSITRTLFSMDISLESFSLLPPYPQIFHGRETELHDVVNILIQDAARVAILGMGGMGKTSIAIAALHSPKVQARYLHRYFVSCDSTPTCVELVSTIADHIGVQKGSGLSGKIIMHFMHAPSSLLVLDNLETAWEASTSRAEVEEFLSLLTDVSHLGLLITMRGTERPAKVKWSRPFLSPLDPISTSAAFQTFIDIADNPHEEDSIMQLLELTGNMPLAVSLIANLTSYEGCTNALSRWKSESTHMLSDGYDKRTSLDISIMLSFTSSRMTQGAQELLSILSMLPDGLTDTDLLQAKLPIENVLACKATLVRTAMAFADKDRLKVLAPIREYALRIHPPAMPLKVKLQRHFHELLALWNRFRYLNTTDILPHISQNLGNFNSVLLDALTTDSPDTILNFESIIYLNGFYRRTQETCSPLIDKLSAKIVHMQDQPIFGDYLIQLFETVQNVPVVDTDKQIALGNQYFQSKPPLEQANWYHALGYYYFWGQTNMDSALEHYQRALSLSNSIGYPTAVGQRALCAIAQIMIFTGHTVEAQQQAEKAQEYATHLGYIYAQAQSLYLQSNCQMIFANYQHTHILLESARALLKSCGLQGGPLDMAITNSEAEIHLLKTEYLESRKLQAFIASTFLPTAYHAILANLNISLIDIATGVDTGLVLANLSTCQTHVKGLHGRYREGLGHIIDNRFAELHVRDGDHSRANTMFAQIFNSTRDTNVEEALMCLEKLADPATGMSTTQTCLQWAGIFLVLALNTKDKLAIMKAFCCLGQILVTQGDEDTALSLFHIALEGFTAMDVHLWRAKCMVHIGDISERRGKLMESVGLWKAARVLFQRVLSG